ncbi:MAG: putative hydrolase of the superfamily [Thermoleophilales bacterium]|nr:putative hydrolase of the superfamily [Thermoleophilales bacterium]
MREAKRGLLVDFGGVLTTNVFDSFRAFCVAEGLPPDTIKEKFRSDPRALGLLRQLEKGELTAQEFSPQFAAVVGVADSNGLVERLFAGIGPDDAMLGAVRAARAAGIRTGLISNSWGDGIAYDPALMEELFDAVVISGDVGLHKPQAEIFELGAEKIGVPAAESVFVDDLKENIAGAEAVGMTGVLHRGAGSTVPELERLLGVSLAER